MSGPKDKVSSTDYVEAGLAEASTPEHACPTCGKAMKDANTRETKEAGKNLRICSSRSCRAVADWASGKGILIDN